MKTLKFSTTGENRNILTKTDNRSNFTWDGKIRDETNPLVPKRLNSINRKKDNVLEIKIESTGKKQQFSSRSNFSSWNLSERLYTLYS